MKHRSDPHDHDAGWAATEIELTDTAGYVARFACRWIEYSHAGKGQGAVAFFIVSLTADASITDADWRRLSFIDGRGKAHHHDIQGVETISPGKVQFGKVK